MPYVGPGPLSFLVVSKLKEHSRNRMFSTNDNILLACNQIFTRILTTENAKTFQKWIECWEWYIEISRYFEKEVRQRTIHIYLHYRGSFNMFL